MGLFGRAGALDVLVRGIRVGIERVTRVSLDDECLHGVFDMEGGGDRKDVSSLVRILITLS
jgi:hypothetical protein